MLKGNLIVGKNQWVVLHANSLEDLVRLAETKVQGATKLRVELSSDEIDSTTASATEQPQSEQGH